MIPNNNNTNNSNGMMNSKSTSALLNRLRPQNENIGMVQKGLNTMQPKSMTISQSTPQLPYPPEANQASSKVSKLRSDISQGNVLMSKTLSASPSAVLLSPNAQVRSQYNQFLATSPQASPTTSHTNRGMTRGATHPEIEASKYDLDEEEEVIDVDTKITVHKNTFIGSLRLSQKQLHDLYKVPQTFFYLRIRQGEVRPGQKDFSDHAVLGTRGSSGSVYDLELVSLDQVDKNNYFTLSKEGVTQFRNKVSQFTGLAQWEREYRLFHKIANINFFRIYKRWKVRNIFFLFIFNLNLWFCRLLLSGEKFCVSER